MNIDLVIAVIIFLVTYGLIISEKIHRSVVALAGAMLVVFFGVIQQEEAIRSIDFNTIGLLIGMMIIVGITRRTGVFEYIAIKSAKLAKGDPWYILLFLSVITAVFSAFLDNVTTVLLIVPVTFSLTAALNLNPVPFLICQVLASNIGGTATLIGDPPNIMIGSATGLGFMDFAVNLIIPIIIVFIVTLFLLKIIYRKELITDDSLKANIMAIDENSTIRDSALLRKSLAVLALTILGFVLHQFLHLESATIALSGAALLLLVTKEEPEDILLSVEWPTIFFFIGLFILVGALEHVGVIEFIAQKSVAATGGALTQTALLILWLSALASAFLDNIPFVATMIPLIKSIGQLGGIENLNPLWWSLSLGACLGGNGTLIGASANVIVAGLAEKSGITISFKGFLKIAFPLMILSIAISTLYIYFRYLAF
ncbi:MAG: putative transporter [Candidatus Dichloromethanomonas elyunquensis]|nr:MAG: putative transporter [Candidatus Dichloromethanomonas elyunquensis]